MKLFEAPMMMVQKLDIEEIMVTSTLCFESFQCKECYCTAVTCSGTYTCDGLVCPGLE